MSWNKTIGNSFMLSALIVTILVSLLFYFEYNPSPIPRYEAFNPQIYKDLLTTLIRKNYTILRAKDYFYGDHNGKVAVLVHDVDGRVPFKGSHVLCEIEREFEVRSGFYLRVDCDYFEQSIQHFQNLEKHGWEIGLHYCCLSRTNNMTLALKMLKAQVYYLRSFFDVSTVRFHGDSYNLSIFNLEMWRQHPEAFTAINVTEASGSDFYDTYIRDASHNMQIPPEEEWGKVVLVNFHADWWA